MYVRGHERSHVGDARCVIVGRPREGHPIIVPRSEKPTLITAAEGHVLRRVCVLLSMSQ